MAIEKKVVHPAQFVEDDGRRWHVESWIMARAFKAVGVDNQAVGRFLRAELELSKLKPEEFKGVFAFVEILPTPPSSTYVQETEVESVNI